MGVAQLRVQVQAQVVVLAGAGADADAGLANGRHVTAVRARVSEEPSGFQPRTTSPKRTVPSVIIMATTGDHWRPLVVCATLLRTSVLAYDWSGVRRNCFSLAR